MSHKILSTFTDLIEAQKELDRPRVGRTVRWEGKAETIADERAALADSLANAPGWSAAVT